MVKNFSEKILYPVNQKARVFRSEMKELEYKIKKALPFRARINGVYIITILLIISTTLFCLNSAATGISAKVSN